MGKWPWRCTSTGQDSSKTLDLEWISPVAAEFQCPQDSWSRHHAHGHAHYDNEVNRPSGCGVPASAQFQEPLSSPWARPLCPHGQNVHMYRTKRFQWTWFGVNQPNGCRIPTSARFLEPLSRAWARPLCLHGEITMMLHIYGLRRFQRTWFGMNHHSGCWVPASARFQKPLLQIPWALITPIGMPMWSQWANEAEAVPMNLIWSESAQWLLSYRPDERTDGRTRPFHSPPFPSERAGDKNDQLNDQLKWPWVIFPDTSNNIDKAGIVIFDLVS